MTTNVIHTPGIIAMMIVEKSLEKPAAKLVAVK